MADIFKNALDLEKKFNKHGHAMRRTILTKAVKSGAEIIQERAGELAPQGPTGELQESIVIRIDSGKSSAAEVIAKIGPDKPRFYGRFQEFGTKFHGKQPFLLPAVAQTIQEALQESADEVEEGLEALG